MRIYQSRTGLSLPDLAARMGYAHRTLIQFVSGARYGDAEGESTAEAVRRFLGENSPPAPEPPPGKLYPAQNLRVCDEMIRYCLGGRWGVLYGPAGGGKSFNFECRAAQAFERTIEPAIVYIYASPEISLHALLKRMAAGLGAPYAYSVDTRREHILWALRRRKDPVALILDEAQNLRGRIDTIEVLREIGDRGRVGILVTGHDELFQVFQPRKGMQFEQWRSRIEQKKRRVLGLSEAEAREILSGELGSLPEPTVKAFVEPATVEDFQSHKSYVSARRLSNAIKDFRELRGKGTGKVH